MTYVVTQLCLDCKYTDCAAVCPTQAFHEGSNMLYINPASCIDCDACVDQCPVHAIFPDSNVPEQYKSDIQLNASECVNFPVIVEKIPALKGPKCTNPNAGD